MDHTHFKKVADASRQFGLYLKEVYGGADEAQRAIEPQIRADSFVPKQANPQSLASATFGQAKSSSKNGRNNTPRKSQTSKVESEGEELAEDEDE